MLRSKIIGNVIGNVINTLPIYWRECDHMGVCAHRLAHREDWATNGPVPGPMLRRSHDYVIQNRITERLFSALTEHSSLADSHPHSTSAISAQNDQLALAHSFFPHAQCVIHTVYQQCINSGYNIYHISDVYGMKDMRMALKIDTHSCVTQTNAVHRRPVHTYAYGIDQVDQHMTTQAHIDECSVYFSARIEKRHTACVVQRL